MEEYESTYPLTIIFKLLCIPLAKCSHALAVGFLNSCFALCQRLLEILRRLQGIEHMCRWRVLSNLAYPLGQGNAPPEGIGYAFDRSSKLFVHRGRLLSASSRYPVARLQPNGD
jgi:hypothetical protein